MRKHRHDDGFTLIETLFQLAVMAIIVQLLLTYIQVFFSFQQTFYARDTAWELFIFEMDELIHVSEEPLTIRLNRQLTRNYLGEDGRIVTEEFEVVNQSFRYSKNGGNEFLLFHVRDIYFTQQQHSLYVEVTFLDGSKKERTFIVPTS